MVPVVVDVDSSCDATDNEWDPSSDQIEPGSKWVLGVREMGDKGEEPGERTLESGSVSHLLSSLNSVRILCQGCKAPTGQAW